MPNNDQIESDKIVLMNLFQKWFRIPEYQRQYVWGDDQIKNLLDDLTFALNNKPHAEYFLGTLVYQKRPADPEHGRPYEENDLLDGQQRLTTILLLFSVLRDLAIQDASLSKEDREDMVNVCQKSIYQKKDRYSGKPEQMRLVFDIRDVVKEFINTFVKEPEGTQQTNKIADFCRDHKDVSVQNMANAINTMTNFWKSSEAPDKGAFLEFINQRALLIYVATEDMEDAFRMFTILNDRGVQLRNSDILKSINLGAVESSSEKTQYATMWEEAESTLGDGFDRFLTFLRTILVKDKARLSLLKEFEDKIYDPKEKDKTTSIRKPQLLQKGKPTFEMVRTYLSHYSSIFDNTHENVFGGSYEFDNLLKIMNYGLPASDWIPPLLFFYNKFQCRQLLDFLRLLNNKFAGDWIGQYSPTYRIESMNQILRVIEQSSSAQEVLKSNAFEFDKDSFVRTMESNIYGRRFALYSVLLLDFKAASHSQKMNFEKLSIEHILPQHPDEQNSQWCRDFSSAEREDWTNKLGNLVIILGNKNTALGNLDFADKKERYFKNKIPTCPRLGQIYANYSTWTLCDLKNNHEQSLHNLKTLFEITQ